MTNSSGAPNQTAAGDTSRFGELSAGLLPRSLHIVVLSSLAVAQPILDVLGRDPEFFVAQDIRGVSLFLLVSALLVIPPLPMVVVEVLLSRSPRRLQGAVHLIFVGLFSFVLGLLLFKRIGVPTPVAAIGFALILAGTAVVAYRRMQVVRSFVSLMAIGLLVVPAGFVLRVRAAGLLTTVQIDGRPLPKVEATAPIVFIVFDEFSSPVLLDENGEINRVRYPNLAALADTSTWYSKAVTVAEYTMAAVPAILTGRQPQAGKLPTYEAHPDNLFSFFGGSYDLWALETMTSLCPKKLNARDTQPVSASDRATEVAHDLWVVFLHLVVPDAVVHRLPPISNTWGGFGDRASASVPEETPSDEGFKGVAKAGIRETRADRRLRVREFADALRNCSDRELYFLHIMLPHGPWDILPSGQRYPAERGAIWGVNPKDNSWPDGDFLPLQAYQRYILQTRYVDRFVGDVRQILEDLEIFDRTLIVLVADHGVAFEPGQRRRNASLGNAHEILPVPLLIKAPYQRQARVVDRLVSVLDIVPTIVSLLGIRSDWEFDGYPQTTEESTRGSPVEFVIAGGGTHEVLPRYLDRMNDVVQRKLEAFGDGTDPMDLFCIGGYPDLVGRRLAELQIGDQLAGTVLIDDEELYRAVDPSGATLPVFVQGVVRADGLPSDPHFAVVVNGSVAAVVPGHPDADLPGRFTALVPPWFLSRGDNTPEIYLVEDRAEGEVLRPVRGG